MASPLQSQDNITDIFKALFVRICQYIQLTTVLAWLFVSSQATASDVYFNGFASIVSGRTYAAKEDRALVDYPAGGQYGSRATMVTETLAGLQMMAFLQEDVFATVQLVGRGTEEFNASIEWAYFTYHLTPEWSLQGGRKRLPLYFYSDFFDVGYSYLWMRPPQDNYTWQIFNYNGFNLTYKTSLINNWALKIDAYTGREDSPKNPFFMRDKKNPIIRFYQRGENWKNIFGLVVNLSKKDMEIRINYMVAELELTNKVLNLEYKSADLDINFYGISFNYDNGKIILLSELNLYQDFFNNNAINSSYYETWLISLGYRIQQWTPYILHSVFDDKNEIERHETLAAGIRWDFHPSIAFKVQADKTRNYGTIVFSSNTEFISVGFDAVF